MPVFFSAQGVGHPIYNDANKQRKGKPLVGRAVAVGLRRLRPWRALASMHLVARAAMRLDVEGLDSDSALRHRPERPTPMLQCRDRDDYRRQAPRRLEHWSCLGSCGEPLFAGVVGGDACTLPSGPWSRALRALLSQPKKVSGESASNLDCASSEGQARQAGRSATQVQMQIAHAACGQAHTYT